MFRPVPSRAPFGSVPLHLVLSVVGGVGMGKRAESAPREILIR